MGICCLFHLVERYGELVADELRRQRINAPDEAFRASDSHGDP